MVRKAALFSLFLAGMLWCLERFADFMFRENLNIKSVYVQRKNIDAEVLALGSSNVLYMFAPKVFQEETGCKAYNLSTNHASFSENLANLHLYLEHNKAPRLLLIGINPADLTLSGSAFHAYLYAPFLGDLFIRGLVNRNDTLYNRYSYIPFMKYALYNEFSNPILVQGLFKWMSGTGAYYPDGFYRVPDDGREFRGYDRFAREHPYGVECRWDKGQSRELEELLSFAAGRGIQVYVYETPFLEESKRYFPGRGAVNRKIEALVRSKGFIYDTFDTLSLCKDRKSFVSAFHLKTAQALVFTRILAKKLSLSSCTGAR